MRGFFIAPQKNKFYRCLSGLIACVLSFSLIFSPTASYAQSVFTLSGVEGLNLPIPGTMIAPSSAFAPVLLKGMTIHPEDPLKFDFIIDSGNTDFTTDQIKQESEKLVKYFLASMTVPKDDLWVNLSPYEDDRIIPDELGKTELGRDMLAQDYILKQLTASLMYPEKELGKKFWDKIYQRAEEEFGTSEIPVNTFNKVWILPESATVYEHEQTVYVVDAKLKVMLDSDYQAMQYEKENGRLKMENGNSNFDLQSSIIKEIIVPEIEREVNEGEHFAPLRQIYHSLILAKWYKETVKNSLLSQVYADKNMTDGVNVDDETIKDQIYAKYMEAYKKGVFNYIKEDYDRLSNEMIPRKYFSGGLGLDNDVEIGRSSSPIEEDSKNPKYRASVKVVPQKDGVDSAMLSKESEEPRTDKSEFKTIEEIHSVLQDIYEKSHQGYRRIGEIRFIDDVKDLVARAETLKVSDRKIIDDALKAHHFYSILVSEHDSSYFDAERSHDKSFDGLPWDPTIPSFSGEIDTTGEREAKDEMEGKVSGALEKISSYLDWLKSLFGERDPQGGLITDDKIEIFIDAAERGDLTKIESLIKKNIDIDVDSMNKYGTTALILATKGGYLNVVRFLLEKGSDINKKNIYGNTALIWASQQGYFDIVKLLLEKGADINIRNKYGFTALMWGFMNDDGNLFKLLLKEEPDEIRESKFKYAQEALRAAVWNHDIDLVKSLLKYIQDREILGQALIAAVDAEDINMVGLLLTANPNVEANGSGGTPLFRAAINNDIETAKLLLEHGARADTDHAYLFITPLTIARERGYQEMVELFERRDRATVSDIGGIDLNKKKFDQSSSPVLAGHHLSDDELNLLRESDEMDGFRSKRDFSEDQVKGQLAKILHNLHWWRTSPLFTEEDITVISQVEEQHFLAGPGTGDEYYMEEPGYQVLSKNYDGIKKRIHIVEADEITEIIDWVKIDPKKNFKGEEVHVLDGAGKDAKIVGRIDRGIAEKYGFIHETANVALITPDGKVLLQLRNKKNFDDHLAMYGGHLGVGESHVSAVMEETLQETGLDKLDSNPIFVGYEGYDVDGDGNKERRSWFVKVLTPQEYQEMKEKKKKEEKELEINKLTISRKDYKAELFKIQERKTGGGEVVDTYEFTFDEISNANVSENSESPYENKTNRFLRVSDIFNGKESVIDAFFAPDSLNRLVSAENVNLWGSIQEMASNILVARERKSSGLLSPSWDQAKLWDHLSQKELDRWRNPDEKNGFLPYRVFDEDSVRLQLSLLFEELRWWRDSVLFTEKEKHAIIQVHELHALAGPGTDSDHYQERDSYRAIKEPYEIIKARVESGKEEKINEIIEWIKTDTKTFKGREVLVFTGDGQNSKIVGRVDLGIAKKLGLEYKEISGVLKNRGIDEDKGGQSSLPIDSSETFDWDRLRDQIIAIEMELNRNSPELTEGERIAIVSVEDSHALADPGSYESGDDTARRIEETREIREAYYRARKRLAEIVAPKVDKMMRRVRNNFDEMVDGREVLFPRSHGTYLRIDRKVAQEFGYSIVDNVMVAFDEGRVREQLLRIFGRAFFLTATDKSAISEVEEGNAFAGPGIFETEDETARRIAEQQPLSDAHDVASEKRALARANSEAVDSRIDEIISWIKTDSKNFKNKEVYVLDEDGEDIGKVDHGVAGKLGLEYSEFVKPEIQIEKIVLGKILPNAIIFSGNEHAEAEKVRKRNPGSRSVEREYGIPKQIRVLSKYQGRILYVFHGEYLIQGRNESFDDEFIRKQNAKKEEGKRLVDEIAAEHPGAIAIKEYTRARDSQRQESLYYTFFVIKEIKEDKDSDFNGDIGDDAGNQERGVGQEIDIDFAMTSDVGGIDMNDVENYVRTLMLVNIREGADAGGYDADLQSYYEVVKNEAVFEALREMIKLNPNAFTKDHMLDLLQSQRQLPMGQLPFGEDFRDSSTSYYSPNFNESNKRERDAIILEAEKMIEEALKVSNDDASSPISDSEEVGGIDLNEIDVNRQGVGVDIQFDPIQVQEIIDMGITGFAPVIINITPLPSVLPLLGLEPRKEEEEAALVKA